MMALKRLMWHRATALVMTWIITIGCLLAGMGLLEVSAESEMLPGDIDGDGKLAMMDAFTLYRTMSGLSPLAEEHKAVCDIDGDGSCSMMDAFVLYRAVAFGNSLSPSEDPAASTNSEATVTTTNTLVSTTITTTTTTAATTTTATTTATRVLTPLPVEEYYGRQLLLGEDNPEMVEGYDYLGEQIRAMKKEISFTDFRITLMEFQRVVRYYHDDHPEVFWMSTAYSYYYYTDRETGVQYIYSMLPNYTCTASEVASYQQQLEARAQEMLEGITDAMPEAKREKLVHDRLVQWASYDQTHGAAHTHDLLGVMINGTGVCESYARAFQYLMHRCGISGALAHGQTNAGEAHMWNVVRLDGEWYQVDATWNDPIMSVSIPNHVSYKYFNMTSEQMLLDRYITMASSTLDRYYYVTYPIPECTATAQNWALSNAVMLTKFDMDTVATVIAKSIQKNDYAFFRPVDGYTMAQFKTDMTRQFWDMVDAINVKLGASQKLNSPGYLETTDDIYGVYGLYLRNM